MANEIAQQRNILKIKKSMVVLFRPRIIHFCQKKFQLNLVTQSCFKRKEDDGVWMPGIGTLHRRPLVRIKPPVFRTLVKYSSVKSSDLCRISDSVQCTFTIQ
jgi:hypothetical protein